MRWNAIDQATTNVFFHRSAFVILEYQWLLTRGPINGKIM